MNDSLFLKLFGGVPLDMLDDIPLIPLGRWLLPIGIYLLITGTYIEKSRNTAVFSCYRYGVVHKWWKHRFRKQLFIGMLMACILMSITIVFDMVKGVTLHREIWETGILWLVHVATIHSLFLLLDLFKVKTMIPAALLLLEGITFLIGYKVEKTACFMYGIWGMYVRSAWCDNINGFPVSMVVIVEVIWVVVSYYIGKIVLKRKM